MKRFIFLILGLVVAGAMAFCITRNRKINAHKASLLETMPELAWMKQDLHLSEKQFAQVTALHEAYKPKCLKMCQDIANAQQKIDVASVGRREMTPELQSAIREHAEQRVICQEAMLRHIYQTAAVMDEKQSAHYLKVVLPYAVGCSPEQTGRARHSHE